MSRPPGVVVSIASVRERKLTPRASRAFTVSIRCGSERPRRSSFHTVRISPSRTKPSAAAKPGRSAFARRLVLEHAHAPGLGERVELQRQILIGRRHSRVADGRHSVPCCPQIRPRIYLSGNPSSNAFDGRDEVRPTATGGEGARYEETRNPFVASARRTL